MATSRGKPFFILARPSSVMRLGAVCLLVSLATTAAASPCKIDRRRYGRIVGSGFGEALVCDGAQLPDLWIRYATDGTITGVHWAERQGASLERTIQLYNSGQISMIAHDSRIHGGFYAQTRGISYQSFPRRNPIAVETDRDGIVVHDPAGHAWRLTGKQLPGKGLRRVSWSVVSIDGVAQKQVPISLQLGGIVGVDLLAAHAFYLETRQPDLSGMSNKRSAKFLATKSIFHDPSGATCSVANQQLYAPSAHDPNDAAEVEFRYATDAELDAFLTGACPKLDRSALGDTVE